MENNGYIFVNCPRTFTNKDNASGRNYCSEGCGNYGNYGNLCLAVRTGNRVKEVYYSLGCGKTESTVESATI